MKISVILGEAWRIYTARFWTIAALVATIWVPCELFNSYLDYNFFGEDDFRKSFKLAQFFENFFGIIATSAVMFLVFGDLEQKKLSYGQSMVSGLAIWGQMWWTRFVGGVLIVLSFLLLILPGIYVCVRLIYAEVIVVREGIYGISALKRSFELSRNQFWFLFRLMLAIWIPLLLAIFLLILPMIFVESLDLWWVDGGFSVLADLLVAYSSVCMVCLYARTREECTPTPLPDVTGETNGESPLR